MNAPSEIRRRGRQAKYVMDPKTGKPIIGLHWWKTRNQYFLYAIDDEGNL